MPCERCGMDTCVCGRTYKTNEGTKLNVARIHILSAVQFRDDPDSVEKYCKLALNALGGMDEGS